MLKSQLVSDFSESAVVRRDLNRMLDRLFVAHRRFNEADAEHVQAAYVARWEILNELEELLQDAVVELAPDGDELTAADNAAKHAAA
jgi:hypothetical protein